MKHLIIDASAASIRDLLDRHGRTDGLAYATWYRVLRPALITGMWVLFALYIHHSLVTVGGTAAELAELIVYVAVVAGMAALLVSWMIICGFHHWIRQRDFAETEALYADTGAPRLSPALWPIGDHLRCVVVTHDDTGRIVDVAPWDEAQVEPVPVIVVEPLPEPLRRSA